MPLQEYCFHLKESQGPTEFIKTRNGFSVKVNGEAVDCHNEEMKSCFTWTPQSEIFFGGEDECVLLQLSVWINSQNASKLLMESGELIRLHEDFCQMNI